MEKFIHRENLVLLKKRLAESHGDAELALATFALRLDAFEARMKSLLTNTNPERS